MKKNELTFGEAWEYIVFLIELGFAKQKVANYIQCDRKFVSGTINRNIDVTSGKPVKIPERCHAKVIELAQVIQLEAWRKKNKDEQT